MSAVYVCSLSQVAATVASTRASHLMTLINASTPVARPASIAEANHLFVGINDIVEAPNAVYLDDGYIALGVGQTMALFDIDRVEVLKGPQGTLFGRNATGGLVHFVTVKPSLNKVEGFVDLRGGAFTTKSSPGTFRGEAALNVPLNDKIAVRGSVKLSVVT